MRCKSRWLVMGLVLGLAVLMLQSAALAKKKKVVQIWHTEPTSSTIQVINDMIAEFEQLHPDVQIKHEPLAWKDLTLKISTNLATGTPPESSHVQVMTIPSLVAKEILLPIDDVIASIGKENIDPKILELSYHNGHYYGVAHMVGSGIVIYRKDLFKKKGLRIPGPTEWYTWDEFLHAAKTLTEDTNGDGRLDTFGLAMPYSSAFVQYTVHDFLGSNGGQFYETNGKPDFTQKRMVELLEWWRELVKYHPPGWQSHQYLETFTMLATGKVAIVPFGWGRAAGYIEKYAAKELQNQDIFGVMPMPVGPSGTNPHNILDAEQFVVFKHAKHPEVAKEFLKFFFKPENYAKYVLSVPIHFFPTIKTVLDMPEYKADPMIKRWQSWLDLSGHQIKHGWASPLFTASPADYRLPFVMELEGSNVLADMVMDVISDDVEPMQAVMKAQKRALQVIKATGYTFE